MQDSESESPAPGGSLARWLRVNLAIRRGLQAPSGHCPWQARPGRATEDSDPQWGRPASGWEATGESDRIAPGDPVLGPLSIARHPGLEAP